MNTDYLGKLCEVCGRPSLIGRIDVIEWPGDDGWVHSAPCAAHYLCEEHARSEPAPTRRLLLSPLKTAGDIDSDLFDREFENNPPRLILLETISGIGMATLVKSHQDD
jgi:hypothetical protein